MKTSMWVKRYHPNTLADIIFQDARQHQTFDAFVSDGDIPNLLLTGIRGTGKSSISKALMNDLKVDSTDVMKVNCSDKNIEHVRDEVIPFTMTMPNGKFKVVRLEEFDYLSLGAQALLRSHIESVATSCRFIATCNYENKVMPELKDRFQRFYFKTPDKEKIAERMVYILEKEGVDFDPEYLLTYIDVGYPSVRQIIQLLQQNTHKKVLQSPKSATSDISEWKFGLLDLITSGNIKAARKLVCESASREEHVEIFTFLYQNLEKLKVRDKEEAIIIIADYARSHGLVDDTELNLAAMFCKLGKI